MAVQLFTNNASSTLSGTLTQGGTTMVLATGEGSRFPAPTGGDYFLLTLFEKDVSSIEFRHEIVKVTARTGDTLTIERDYEGMTGTAGGYSYPSIGGAVVYCELRWTAAGAGNLLQASDNLAGLSDPALARTNLGIGNVIFEGDARLTDSRPASDVYAWAKAATKPSYTKADVGLGSVDNTSDANKPVSTATQTALNGKAATGHTHTGTYEPVITAGTTAQYYRGDKTWQTLPTGGDASTNTATSVDSEVVLFSGTGGKTLKRATGSGLAKLTSGALSTATAGTDYVAPDTATSFTKPQRPSLSTETAPSANAVTWDLTSDQVFRINLDANITTFNLTGTLSSLAGNQYQAIVRYNGGSSITWNANIKWPAGTAPTLTGTSGKVDTFTFVVSSTDGTNFYLINTGKTQNV